MRKKTLSSLDKISKQVEILLDVTKETHLIYRKVLLLKNTVEDIEEYFKLKARQ